MCGIAGLITKNGSPPDPATLDRLLAAIAHRGPDGTGRLVRANTALLHARLAIIDLQTGDQPLYAPGGTALICNGEIYNNPELRAAMADTPFTTKSDCEPAVFLYERQGEKFAQHLRGSFDESVALCGNDNVPAVADSSGDVLDCALGIAGETWNRSARA